MLTIDLVDNDTSQPPSKLDKALVEFKQNYERFAKANKQYLLLDDDLGDVFESLDPKAKNFSIGVKDLQGKLKTTMETIEKKYKCNQATWLGKLGGFVSKFYPIARLSLDLTSTIAGVFHIRYTLTKGSHPTTQRCNSWAWDYFTGTAAISGAHVVIE